MTQYLAAIHAAHIVSNDSERNCLRPESPLHIPTTNRLFVSADSRYSSGISPQGGSVRWLRTVFLVQSRAVARA